MSAEPDNEKIRVLLADDHPLVLDGVSACLATFDHIEVVAAVAHGRDALERAHDLQPDIAVLDINMPSLNGLDVAELFKEQLPDVKLVILSMHSSREYVATALMNGARGYVLKEASSNEIVTAIDIVHRGGSYFSSGISDLLGDVQSQNVQRQALTTREQAILLHLADGDTNKEVARRLGISIRTVETHRRNLKKKLGIATTAGLTRYVIESGIRKFRA